MPKNDHLELFHLNCDGMVHKMYPNVFVGLNFDYLENWVIFKILNWNIMPKRISPTRVNPWNSTVLFNRLWSTCGCGLLYRTHYGFLKQIFWRENEFIAPPSDIISFLCSGFNHEWGAFKLVKKKINFVELNRKT